MAAVGGATWYILLLALCATWQCEGKTFSNTLRRAVVDRDTTGAVCLDGSPPVYYYRKGRGPGVKAWHIHFEGGGWCVGTVDCYFRSLNSMGSSSNYSSTAAFRGIFNSKPELNPDFYNWNHVYVKYCDGGSFTGNMDKALLFKGRYLYFRGYRIVDAVLKDLMAKGFSEATWVLMGGDSAGGLASFFHCDRIAKQLRPSVNFKCYSDAGMFVDVLDLSGNPTVGNMFHQVYTFHNSSGSMPSLCTNRTSPLFRYKCFFPQKFLSFMATPFFIVNSNYDSYSLRNFLAPARVDPKGRILRQCLDNFSWNCSSSQIDLMQRMRDALVKAVGPFYAQPNKGVFAYSCFLHRVAHQDNYWLRLKVQNRSLGQSFGDWAFNRSAATRWLSDCPFPCNTCNLKFGKSS